MWERYHELRGWLRIVPRLRAAIALGASASWRFRLVKDRFVKTSEIREGLPRYGSAEVVEVPQAGLALHRE